MRWFWIDRYTEFVAGERATAIKCLTYSEEYWHDQMLGHRMMPHPLIIEGIAQTGGLLVAQRSDFRDRIVLAKIRRSTFHRFAEPGETLTYSVQLDDYQDEGAFVSGTAKIDGELQAEVELFFANVRDDSLPESFFEPSDLLYMLRMLKVFELGRTSDGVALAEPEWMSKAAAAERD